MAQGDSADMAARLRGLLPAGWFTDDAPVLGALLTGFAVSWSWLFGLIGFAKAQGRLATASAGWLDLFAADYGGAGWARAAGESDDAYRARIGRLLRRSRGTRAALVAAVTDLTGRAPVIVEPALASDTGTLNGPDLGWGQAGAWGSLALPFQCFVTAYRPRGGGIADVAGYGAPGASPALGGWGGGAIAWATPAMVSGAVTDAAILAAIAEAMPVGTIAWTRLSN